MYTNRSGLFTACWYLTISGNHRISTVMADCH